MADSPPSNFLLDNDVTTTAVACSREVDDSSSYGSDTNSQSKLVDQLPSTPDDECSQEKISPPSTPTSSTTRGSFTSSPHLQQQLLDNVGMKTCSEEEANIELPNVIDARCGDAENFSQSCKQDQCVSKVEKDVESGESNNSSPLICRFRNLVKDETQVLQDLISKWNSELETAEQNSCPNEVCDDIRAVIGKTGLIISQRFTQFLSLVNQADGKTVSPSAKTASRKVYESDLDGFWEMDYIQVKKVKDSFSQLEERKNNDWKILSTPIKSTENNQVKKKRKATKKTPSPSLSPEAIEKRKIAQMERKKIMQAMREKRKQEMKESSQQDFVSIINIKEPVSAVIEHPPIITTDPMLENKKEITNVVITAENEHHLFHHITPLKGDNDKINTTLQHTALVG